MKFTGYVRTSYDGKDVREYPEGACSPVPDTISNAIPDGPIHGPFLQTLEEKTLLLLEQFPDWAITWKQFEEKKNRFAIELEQEKFSISFRMGGNGYSYGLYQDGVINPDGVPEKVRVKYQVGATGDPLGDFKNCMDECLLHILHAL